LQLGGSFKTLFSFVAVSLVLMGTSKVEPAVSQQCIYGTCKAKKEIKL
jgi:hypothetical protein